MTEASGHKGVKTKKLPKAKNCDANEGQKCRPKDAPTVGHTTTKQRMKKKAFTESANTMTAQSREAGQKRRKVMDQKGLEIQKQIEKSFA